MENTLKIEYNIEDTLKALTDSIKEELHKDISDEIRAEIKAEIKAELKEKIRVGIEEKTEVYVENMMNDIYNNEMITIGGGWNEPEKTFTLKEYVIEQIKERIANGNAKGKRYSGTSFNEWFKEECVSADIEYIISNNIRAIRDNVNSKVKNIFTQSTKDLLSETVLNVLMSSENYKNIENSMAKIANKK